MRSRLRWFLIVGVLATIVDVGGLTLWATRRVGVGWSSSGDSGLLWGVDGLLAGDALFLTLAALTAYWLNRGWTFRGVPDARWVHDPATFASLAVAAGLVDLAVLALAIGTGAPILAAKVAAVLLAAGLRWVGYRWVLFVEVRRELAERSPRIPPPGDARLTVVVPAYNEGPTVASTVEALRSALTVDGGVAADELEILVVDDGSSDDTADIAAAAGARVIELGRNRGKGAAVRVGFIEARGRSVVFTDADLAYSPAAVREVLARLEEGWDFVVGSRRHTDTNTLVRARRLREIGGRVVNWFTQLVLLGRFRDTQCGLKGFRSDIGRVVFERTVIDGFAFDVELFLMAEQDHLSVAEIPVEVVNRAGSSVRIVDHTVELLRDLLRIRRRVGAGGYRPTYHQELVLRGTLDDPPAGERKWHE